jgi:nitroreductase
MKNWIKYEGNPVKPEEMVNVSRSFYQLMNKRRSVRVFSDREVPKSVIENIIKTASTAPSGAHKQPWTFCIVSNPSIKQKIRKAAEKEEYINYNSRMSQDWLDDLKVFDTDWHKEFLETAPYLIIVFKKSFDLNAKGEKSKNYYVNESVGIACGILITAIHNAGLVTLTHTPSPMNFLQDILERPSNERPFLLLPVGYPGDGVEVPDIKRKKLEDISVWFE